MTPAPTATKLERLRIAVAAQAAVLSAPRPRPVRRAPPPIQAVFQGAWEETDHGLAFVRETWFPSDHQHGAARLAPAQADASVIGLLAQGATVSPTQLGFFDIETTGLSGGTGTYVVLAGIGWFEDGCFRLRQHFLADIADEAAMLSLLAQDFCRFEGLVTYNGKAFDVPLTASRFALARQRWRGDGLPHIDLLHGVRRMYRHRMPTCRLSDAERRILRLDRPDDIPGALIPRLYFDYVRAGQADPLRAVFAHNADDVLSMVGILASLLKLLQGGDLDPNDGVAVARWRERTGDLAGAMELYRAALESLEGDEDWAWAAGRHAALCRRSGLRAEAADLWERLWAAGERRAGLELAKHLEHQARDFPAAEGIVQELLAGSEGVEAVQLRARLARIRRRVERPRPGNSPAGRRG